MRAALAIISVVVLAIHAVVFRDQLFDRWQEHQGDYFRRAAELADTPELKQSLLDRRPAIEQTIVRSFGPERVDRCATCHIAVEDPRFEAADQPLRSHPPVPGHSFQSFGCTICHDGQGRAVRAEAAHDGGHDWPSPRLPKEMIEANCVQCHAEADWPHAPRVNEGRRLFFERACYTCHAIAGLSMGSVGPELSDIGRKRRAEVLKAKIEDPRASNPTSSMPRQDLTPDQVLALVTFLKAQKGSNITRAPLAQFVSSQQERPRWLPLTLILGSERARQVEALETTARGEQLVRSVGCLSCHRLDDRDGGVGPELTWSAAQRDHAWLMTHFRDPKSVIPGSLMPPYPLPEEMFDALSRYLLSRQLPVLPAEPRHQYAMLCARCHGEAGRGDGLIARYLDPAPRDLTKTAFMKTKPKQRFVASVSGGVGGTSMAAWGKLLGPERTEALVSWVLETYSKGEARPPKTRAVPEANPVAFSAESVARGEAIYLARCWGCHGKKADGHGPNADDISPRPRNLRARAFVESIPYARLHESIKYGVQGTAMPAAGFDFGLDDQAIGDLVNFIHSLNRPAGEAPRVASLERR